MRSLPFFKSSDELITQVFFPILTSKSTEIIADAVLAISKIICTGTSSYSIKIYWNEIEKNLETQLLCQQCNDRVNEDKNTIITHGLFSKPFEDHNLKYKIAEKAHNLFAIENCNVRKNLAKVLLPLVRHVNFYEEHFVETWMTLVTDSNKEVRKSFTAVIADIVKAVQVFF